MKLSAKFIENLSIHGIRYIFNDQSNKSSRLFWIFIFIGSLCGLSYYNVNLYIKFSISPDISIRVREKFTNRFPFPAITICTPLFGPTKYVNYYNFLRDFRLKKDEIQNLTVEEQNYLASNIQACNPNYAKQVDRNTQNRTERDMVKLMNKSYLQIPEALIQCGYRGVVSNCTKQFNRVLTDRGYCYSFNLQAFNTIFNEEAISKDFHCFKRLNIAKSMNIHNQLINETVNDENEQVEWTLENGYIESHQTDSIPVKAQKGNIISANILIREKDASNLCAQLGNVFSVYLHLPNEILVLNWHHELDVEFRRKKDIILRAKSYTADKGMRNFEPEARGCYFEGEKQLKFFKTYTKALCELECMTNHTLKTCGCVKFSMPRTLDTRICDVNETQCFFDAMNLWPNYEKESDKFEATCGCLKSCNDIKYEIKYEKTSALENLNSVMYLYNITQGDAVSRITFMFDEFLTLEYEEYASYKLQNFIADVGGLLGFFLGCSILSLIEIFYFLVEFCASKLKERIQAKTHFSSRKITHSLKNKEYCDKDFLKTMCKVSKEVYIHPSRLYQKSNNGCYVI